MPLYLFDLQDNRLPGVRSITTIIRGAGTRSTQAILMLFNYSIACE